MSDAPAVKIKLTDVRLGFGANRVLDGIDLDVYEGLNTVLIGGAASGKSVLMKAIIGLHRAESGRIEVDGVDTARFNGSDRIKLMERFGILFQHSALFDSLPVWENITFKLIQTKRIQRNAAKDLAVEKLLQVGLGADVADLFPASLSGGMQKRVGLARAIAGDPEILMLDDPTAGLDPIMTLAINRLINKCVQELGATALSITGDMTSARHQYDRLAMIHDGHIVWSGATADIDAADNPYLEQLINGRAQGPMKMRVHAR